MPYVVSTISTDQRYVDYHPNTDGGANVPIQEVFIKGGANVAAGVQMQGDGTITPPGAVTQVTDEQLAILKNISLFNQHMNEGYLKVVDHFVEPAKIAREVQKDMTPRDESAPITEEDFGKGGRLAGQTPLSVSEKAESDPEPAARTGFFNRSKDDK